MKRLLALAALGVSSLFGQVRVFLVDGAAEQPLGAVAELGEIEAGLVRDFSLRIRNGGAAPERLDTVSVAGAGFSLTRTVQTPLSLTAGGSADAALRFQPTGRGSFSATLTIGPQRILLRASAKPGLVVWWEQGTKRLPLAPGDIVDFGSVEAGSQATRRLLVENTAAAAVSFPLAIAGAAFRVPWSLPPTASLGAGVSAPLDVTFQPEEAGEHQGALQLADRTYPFRGIATNPPLPAAGIAVLPQPVRSGQQAKASVKLAAPARFDVSGRLRLEFTPAKADAGDDPGILFLANSSRSIDFAVRRGEDFARFGSAAEADFQTGTTAGTLTLRIEWAGPDASARVPLAPEPVIIDTAQAFAAGGKLEVAVTGFDNARSASQLAFTFYEQDGRAAEPGRIALDAAADFQAWFARSNLGGLFSLRATFPVTGDLSRISAVEVEITNAIGVARSERIAVRK